MKLLRKIFTTSFVTLLLFFGLSFVMNKSIQQYAAAPCTSYLQPNQCTVGPDQGPHQGVNYIVDKCDNGSGEFNYYCFDPTKDQYYTQPDTCTVGPYQYNQPGHLFLVKKVAPSTFYCVTDCTTYPGFPGCPASSTSPTPPSGYTFCSNENSTCTLKGTEDIAYGASGKFNYFSSKTGSVMCNNTLLGPDPILNTAKYCFVKPSGTGGSGTTLSLVLGLPGIGINTGAVGSIPNHLVRNVKVELYDATVTNPGGPGTTPLGSGTGIVTYDSQGNNAGYFDSVTSPAKPISITFKGTLPTNNEYKVLVEMPQYLFQLALPLTQADTNIPTAFVITQGANVITSPTTLNPGALTQPNSMSIIADYNQIYTCFKNSTDPTCNKTADGILFTDLDDNGVVDLVDFNIWIRSLSVLQQIQPSVCNGGSCKGE